MITPAQPQLPRLCALLAEYNEANGLYDVDSYRMCLFKASDEAVIECN
jgi:hypothetical protein